MNTTTRLIAAATLALPMIAGAQTTGTQTPSGSSIMSPNSAVPSTSGPSMPNTALPSAPTATRPGGAMTNPNEGALVNRPTTSNRSMGTSTDKTPMGAPSGSYPTNTVDPTTTR